MIVQEINMGTDIWCRAEQRVDGEWHVIDGLAPFDWRSYRVFAFLADIRNSWPIPPIAPRRGLPDDSPNVDEAELGDHSYSWLSLAELAAFNYDALLKERQATDPPGAGRMTTYREFLGARFFAELVRLTHAGADRIVFGFDS